MHLSPESLARATEAALGTVRSVCLMTEADPQAGRTTLIVTCGRAVDLRAVSDDRRAITHRKVDRRAERTYARELEAMREFLIDAIGPQPLGTPLAPEETARVRETVAKLCPKAWIVQDIDELASAVRRCFAEGDIGIEPMFGQGNIWWLMGHRM